MYGTFDKSSDMSGEEATTHAYEQSCAICSGNRRVVTKLVHGAEEILRTTESFDSSR